MVKNLDIDLLVFDLDGTLLHSIERMKEAWAVVQTELNIDAPFEEYEKYLGKPFEEILFNIGLSENHEKIREIYFNVKEAGTAPQLLYDGVSETLTKLAKDGYQLAIFTGKPLDATKKALEDFGLTHFFPIVRTGDDVPKAQSGKKSKGKPDKFLLKKIIAEAKTSPERTIMIGDMDDDARSANSANTCYIHADYGYQGTKPQPPIVVDYHIQSFPDLIPILDRLNPGRN